MFFASAAWLAGIAVMLLYSAVTYLRLHWQVRAAVSHGKNIYICDDVTSPFILGTLRPRIYIPSGISEQQLQYVLSHENAHIKRRDHWWKPLGFLLLTLYWFNPLLWLAYSLLCRDIEQACDEKVIARMDNAGKKGYSEALVVCSVHRRTVMACPVAFGEIGVKDRIKGIVSYKKPAFWIILASVAVCLLVAVCFLTNPKQCAHEYQSTLTMPATCTQKGMETLTCTLCEHSYTAPVSELAHTYDRGVVLTEPTCIQIGSQKLTCTGCGAVKSEPLGKTGHTAGELTVTKEPNCTEKGEQSSTCTVCQEVFVAQLLETNGVHDMQETVLRAATCAAAGEGVNTCSRCGHSESCAYAQLPHSYKEGTTIPSTCITKGSKQKVCTGCGHEKWEELPLDTETHQWRYMGFYWPEQCALCGKTKPDSQPERSLEYSLIPNTGSSEQTPPVIRIWP